MVTIDGVDCQLLLQRVDFLNQSQKYSIQEFEAYQLKELQRLLAHCNQNVPYYQQLFKENNIDVSAIRTMSDLRTIPLLTKDIIRQRHEEFVARNYNFSDLTYMTSGGSTGAPLKVYMDQEFKTYNHANTFYYLGLLGFEPGQNPSIRLHGDKLPDELMSKNIFWRQDGNRLTMSTYHIQEETAIIYAKEMNRHRPVYIHGYPSATALLAQYFDRLSIKLDNPIQYVFSDCETLYPAQRKLIEKVFKCPIINIYGHTEGAVFGMTCPKSDLMHIHPQIGICELLNPDGSPVTEEGKKGEIVVTGFNNYVFPFVRYRTYDIGVYTKEKCSCGRNFMFLKDIEGRIQDYIVDKKGQFVPIGPALFDYHVDWSGVDQFQIMQEKKGEIVFKLMINLQLKAKSQEIISRIKDAFTQLLNNQFVVSAESVDAIGFTRIGKYRYLDQKLDVVNRSF